MEDILNIDVNAATYEELCDAYKKIYDLQNDIIETYRVNISDYVNIYSAGTIELTNIYWRGITLRSTNIDSKSTRYDIKLSFNYSEMDNPDNEDIEIDSMSSIPNITINGNIEPDDEKECRNTIHHLDAYLMIISRGEFFRGLVIEMKSMKEEYMSINSVMRGVVHAKSNMESRREAEKERQDILDKFKKFIDEVKVNNDNYMVIEQDNDGYLLYKNESYIISSRYHYIPHNGVKEFEVLDKKVKWPSDARCVMVRSLKWADSKKPVLN